MSVTPHIDDLSDIDLEARRAEALSYDWRDDYPRPTVQHRWLFELINDSWCTEGVEDLCCPCTDARVQGTLLVVGEDRT